MQIPDPPRTDPVDRVVVESHSMMRPHQEAYARILIGKAEEDNQILANPMVKCDVHGCKHDKLALLMCLDCGKSCSSRSGLTLHRKRCKGDKLVDPVIRALSRKFNVDTKSGDPLTSCVVLAEVKLSDYPNLKAAKKAVRKMAQPDHVLFKQKGLDVLSKIKRPLEHGYSEDEVTKAAMPFIMRHANMYANHNCDKDDCVSQGWIGVRKTINSDRAIAPFSSHVFLHIRTNIRRYVTQCGTIRHGERDGDFFGNRGVMIGYKKDDYGDFLWHCSKCHVEWGNMKKQNCPECGNKNVSKVQLYGTLSSADAEIKPGFALKDAMKSQTSTPLDIVMEKDVREHKYNLLRLIIEAAGFTEQQTMYVNSEYGLDGEEELSGQALADRLGNSRQRVGQQRNKCQEKLQSAAKLLGIDWSMLDDDDNSCPKDED